MHARTWIAIGIAAFGWGTSSPATRAALAAEIPPVGLVAWRTLIGAVILAVLIGATGRRYPRERAAWSMGAVMGFANLALPFVTLVLALQFASSGFVGLLIALVPLVTAVLAHYVLPGEPLYRGKVVGLSVALGGVAVLLLSGDSGLGAVGRPLLAASLALIGVLAIAFSGVYAKQRHAHYDPLVLTGMQFIVGFVLIFCWMLIVEGMPGAFSAWGWFLILYVTVPGSVVPFLLYYWVLKHATATKASLTAYVVPLIALVSGIVALDEQLELGIAVGGVLILAGVLIIDRNDRRRAQEVPEAAPASG